MDAFSYINATLSARGMGLRTARVVENASPVDERSDLRVLQRRIRFEAHLGGITPPFNGDLVGRVLRLQIDDLGLDDETEQLPTPRRVIEAELTVERPCPATRKRSERTVESKRMDTPDPRPKRRKQACPKKSVP